MPPLERLRELFTYDPQTGFLYNRVDRGRGKVKAGSVAGHPDKEGYLHTSVDGKKQRVNRIVWALHNGRLPVDDVDHINTDRKDNRPGNLREATKATNAQNIRRARRHNKTGLLGVHATPQGFVASIGLGGSGRSHYLGVFDTPEEAHQTYLDAKRALHIGNTL